MNPRRLFVASCISLVASAFSFIMRQDVLPAWGRSFDLNAKELGLIGGIAFWGIPPRWPSARSSWTRSG
jgi:putative MFS transporter